MPSFPGMDDKNLVSLAGHYATSVIKGLSLFFVHFGHDVGQICCDFLAHVSDKLGALVSDADHDLAAVFSGMNPLHITELFKSVDKPSSRSRGMSHFLGDVGHRQVVLARKVGEQEKLGERDVTAVKLVGEVEDAGALCEEDKVRKTISVRLDCTS